MELISAANMTELDRMSCKTINSIDLMEAAGKAMAGVILDRYNPKSALVVLGSGGNAGDGLVVARHLMENGVLVDTYTISSIKNEDAKVNKTRFKGQNCQNWPILDKYSVIVDAILGNGLKTPIKEEYLKIINKINESGKIIVSLDVPSGLNSDNGLSMGGYVHANLCITVEYPKTGLYLNDGMNIGEIVTIKCGMIDFNCDLIHVNDYNDFKDYVPKRDRNSNKGSFKKSAIIAGSKSYPGASLISYNALNAFKMGVGYSRLYVPKSLYDLYALRFPEVIVSALKDVDGFIKYNEEELDDIMKSSDSISIGMGMGVSDDLYKTIKYLLENYDKTLIIDADGLNTLAKYGSDILKCHRCEVIITPHPKEFERISGISLDDIKNNPIEVTKRFAYENNIVVILKGSSSVISDGDRVSLNIAGGTGLAKGGSGDALSGILAGASAYIRECACDINARTYIDEHTHTYNNLSAYTCACMGAYFLGMACSYSMEENPPESLTISEITKYIPNVWKLIKGGK